MYRGRAITHIRRRAWLSLAPLMMAFVLLLMQLSLAQAEPKFPPSSSGPILDEAHLLTPADRAAIESELKALEAKTGDQLVVYTTDSLQGYPIEDFGYQLGRAWGIGQKGLNNGAILIVAPKERKVRIEVGRGLEPQLTDLLSSLIIRNQILPAFRRGEFSAGIRAGVRDIRDVMLGDAEAVKERVAARKTALRKAPINEGLLTFVFIIIVFAVVWWAQSQQARQPLSGGRSGRSGYGGPIFFPGGWSGGGGGGGGGEEAGPAAVAISVAAALQATGS